MGATVAKLWWIQFILDHYTVEDYLSWFCRSILKFSRIKYMSILWGLGIEEISRSKMRPFWNGRLVGCVFRACVRSCYSSTVCVFWVLTIHGYCSWCFITELQHYLCKRDEGIPYSVQIILLMMSYELAPSWFSRCVIHSISFSVREVEQGKSINSIFDALIQPACLNWMKSVRKKMAVSPLIFYYFRESYQIPKSWIRRHGLYNMVLQRQLG